MVFSTYCHFNVMCQVLPTSRVLSRKFLFGGGGGALNMYGRGPFGARRFCKECTERYVRPKEKKSLWGGGKLERFFFGGGASPPTG